MHTWVRRLVFIAAIFIFFGGIFLWEMHHDNILQIKSSVRHEAVSLSATQDGLHTLQLGRLKGLNMSGIGASLTGFFTFKGSYSNQPCDIIVYWTKTETNAPIDKIEIQNTSDQPPKLLWSVN